MGYLCCACLPPINFITKNAIFRFFLFVCCIIVVRIVFYVQLLMFRYNTSLRELYDYSCDFQVNNSKKLRSDALIGSFKLSIGSVYDQDGKCYKFT